MDAVEYLKTLQRMCRSNMECITCPIYKVTGRGCGLFSAESEKLVSTVTPVENWAKEHPVRTRKSVFLGQYPHAKLDNNCALDISPCDIEGGTCRSMGSVELTCAECKQKYWLEEVPDDD